MEATLIAGAFVGAGALGGAHWAVGQVRQAWDAYIDRRVVERTPAPRPDAHITPDFMANLILKKFNPALTEMGGVLLEMAVRLKAIEKRVGQSATSPDGIAATSPQPVIDDAEEEEGTEQASTADLKFSAVIGQNSRGVEVTIDLENLVSTRLLVTATSGSGKSWALRRLIEQTHKRVQQIIIDPEGEFQSLREIGMGILEITEDLLPAAETLAREMMKSKKSYVLDISELPPFERVDFVNLFLGGLVNIKRELWSPVMVVIDESQMFAPQGGSPATSKALKDLLARGRKRGQFAVLATQRISKLNKDVVAECMNVMIGRSRLDIDVDRGLESLGLNNGDLIRGLQVGEFFCHGPAFGNARQQVIVGPVETTHPKVGV